MTGTFTSMPFPPDPARHFRGPPLYPRRSTVVLEEGVGAARVMVEAVGGSSRMAYTDREPELESFLEVYLNLGE